jgi:Tol biopolymer transport system component
MALTIGTQLGSHEITALLGKGGMGEVYRARDLKLKREVAIKILPEEFSRDSDRISRFQREAEVLASLNHPNIAGIYDLAEASGTRFLVLELVEGETLADRIARGPIPADEALDIAKQIAEALEAAHERGIIHRDLKPANVKLTPDGKVKVLDFGLAKAMEGAPTNAMVSNSPTLLSGTVGGMLIGTAAYMSPEQAAGKPVDKRADIWSFGVVLWEMFAGEQLFKGETVSHILASVLKDEPDLSRVPLKARRLLRRCMEKDPRKRLRDIGEARFLIDDSSAAPAPVLAPRRTWLAWTAGAMAVVAAVFAMLWLRPAPLPQVVRFEIHAPAGSTLPLGTPAPSPDGRMLAFTVNDPDGKVRIHLRSIDRVETRALSGTEGAAHPFWSPNGRSLAFVAGNPLRLKLIDIQGESAARDLSASVGPWHGTWNQNGDILFLGFGGGEGVHLTRIQAESGSVTTVPGGGTFPYFLQDGKRFLVSTIVANGKRSIQLAMLGSEKRTMVIDDVDTAPILAPTPQGKVYLLYLRESDLYAQEFDERSGSLRGNPMLVVSNVRRLASPAVAAAVGVSPSGILAYQTGSDFNMNMGQLVWVDRSGKRGDPLPSDVSGRSPELSPDGLSVAVVRTNPSGGESVWITDLVRKSSRRLTFGAGTVRDMNPVWSPDSLRIAFLRLGGGKDGGVHIVDRKDNSKNQVVHEEAATVQSWSPDGKYLLLTSAGRQLSLLPLAGDQKPIPVGSPNGRSSVGRISPDNKFIAFTSDEEGQNEIYVQPMPPNTAPIKVSNGGGIYPRWSKDSKELFFLSRGTFMAVDVRANGTASEPHRMFEIKDVVPSDVAVADYDVRPDGRQFLIYMVPRQPLQDAPITVVLNWWAGLRQQP